MVDERYRDRSGRIVVLTYEQLAELDRMRSTCVEIGGTDVELVVDGFEEQYDTDTTLTFGPESADELWSGFPVQFYGVLDGEGAGDGDVVFLAEDFPERMFTMEDEAGGLLSIGDELDRLERRHMGEELRHNA